MCRDGSGAEPTSSQSKGVDFNPSAGFWSTQWPGSGEAALRKASIPPDSPRRSSVGRRSVVVGRCRSSVGEPCFSLFFFKARNAATGKRIADTGLPCSTLALGFFAGQGRFLDGQVRIPSAASKPGGESGGALLLLRVRGSCPCYLCYPCYPRYLEKTHSERACLHVLGSTGSTGSKRV